MCRGKANSLSLGKRMRTALFGSTRRVVSWWWCAVKRVKDAVVVVDSVCSCEGELTAVAFSRAGMRLILVDRNQQGAAEIAKNLSLLMGWDPVDEDRRVVSAQVGELNLATAPELAELALREFGRLPDVVADVHGCVDAGFLWQLRALSGTGECGLGSARIMLDYATEFASSRSCMEQDVLGHSQRLRSLMLEDLPGKQPCLQVLFPKTSLDSAVAKILDVGHAHACTCEVMTNNPIMFVSHILSGNSGCPPYKIGRGGGLMHIPFINNHMDAQRKGHAYLGEESPSSLHENLKSIDDDSVSNTRIAPQEDINTCINENKKMPRELIKKNPAASRESARPKDVSMVRNTVAPANNPIMEPHPEEEVLAVLDCRCQYEIIQKRVKRSIRWAFLGYVVVMSAIPSLLMGSSNRY